MTTVNTSRQNIVLAGFMATGKSSVGRQLAVLLGYDFVDLDTLIIANAGMPIPQIFATQGEPAFRSLESHLVEQVAGRTGCVIATGGGTIVNPRNLELLKRNGVVITLAVDPQTILSRIGTGDDRPMLWGGDKLERIRTLLAQRAPAYMKADLIVDASAKTVEEVAQHILNFLALHRVAVSRTMAIELPDKIANVQFFFGAQSCEAYIGPGLLGEMEKLLRDCDVARTGILITNPHDHGLYGQRLLQILERAGFTVRAIEIPENEEEKKPETLSELYRHMAGQHLNSRSPVFALGGAVIKELAGYAAATYLRGLPWILIPTTLMAQLDAAISGTVHMNLPYGKNLLGAFHPPALVVIDTETLEAPEIHDFRAGLAEVVKVATIQDLVFFEYLENNSAAIISRDNQVLCRMITRACGIRASIANADLRDAGFRSLLDFGSSVGNVLQSVAVSQELRRGEAVAVGMMVAATLSHQRGMCSQEDLQRLKRLLQSLGLLAELPVGAATVMRYVRQDQQIRNELARFVLQRGIGDAAIVSIENLNELQNALEAVM